MNQDTQHIATDIRKRVLRMLSKGKSSHAGSNLSVADILAVLYWNILRIDPKYPDMDERDRFLMSKGHAAAATYATLALRGFFPLDWLETYYQNNGYLAGHVTYGVPGVDFSAGSLGHGLPSGCGMAIAGKMNLDARRVFVVLSDGELDEGSVWEAVLFAAHHRLDNLVAIVDYNKMQSLDFVEKTLGLEPLREKWESFGWIVKEVDGHNHNEIAEALQEVPLKEGKPLCVIAHTVKGKGVSFMENNILWHYRTPEGDELEKALNELS